MPVFILRTLIVYLVIIAAMRLKGSIEVYDPKFLL